MTRNSLMAVSMGGLMATIFAGCANQASAEPPKTQGAVSQMIGFSGEQDLFEVFPGDQISLEQSEGKQAMRWTTNMTGKHRACVKTLKAAPTAGATKMRFHVRTDTPGELWVQVNESDGEGFYKIISAGKEWKEVSIDLAEMKLNTDKVKDRKLDINKISKIIVIDLVGLNHTSGKRSVWFADLGFTDDETKLGDQAQGLAPNKPQNVRVMPTLNRSSLAAKVDSVLPREEEQRWLRIPWRPNLMQGRIDAQQQRKPMLIWIMDGNVLGCT